MGVVHTGKASFRATMVFDDLRFDLEQIDGDPALQAGGMELGQFLERRRRDPARAERIAKARAAIGKELMKTETGLAALRLRAGLSQTELAKRMETHQPAIARWESNPGAMQLLTIRKMAAALGCTELKVFEACTASNASEDAHVAA